jgi:hypothetical protein
MVRLSPDSKQLFPYSASHRAGRPAPRGAWYLWAALALALLGSTGCGNSDNGGRPPQAAPVSENPQAPGDPRAGQGAVNPNPANGGGTPVLGNGDSTGGILSDEEVRSAVLALGVKDKIIINSKDKDKVVISTNPGGGAEGERRTFSAAQLRAALSTGS